MLGSQKAEAEIRMPVLVIFEKVLPGERGEGSRLGEKKEAISRRGGLAGVKLQPDLMGSYRA